MVIYIHGFGGSGEGSKAKAFRDYFQSIGEDFIAPSLSYVPELAIGTLQELIRSYHGEVYLIGSSLGGYYATYLSRMEEVKKTVLINPATKPDETLSRALGEAPNFYDDSYFQWNKKHIEMLKSYASDSFFLHIRRDDFLVMLQKGDALLDYKDALTKYDGCQVVVEEGGSHSFEGIERYFEAIRAFFGIGDHFKHTNKIKGVGLELEEVAERVGDLYYDDMARFLKALATKLKKDASADRRRGRIKLSEHLDKSAKYIQESAEEIKEAWRVCKYPTIRWMIKNGFNKRFDFTTGRYPKDILSWYYEHELTMPEEILHEVRKYYMKKFKEANSIDAPMSGIGTRGDLARFNMGVFDELEERYPEYSDEIAVILREHFKF